MGAIVRIHHPTLTPEEREYRMVQLKQATKEFYKEVTRSEKEIPKSKKN
jgi:hypothetical protein